MVWPGNLHSKRHSRKFCWTEYLDHTRAICHVIYYVRWIFWGWKMAHGENWLISEDWLSLLKASWESRIHEWHGHISNIKDMCGGTCRCLVWSIWEWKPNTIPCGTQSGLSASWLEAHTLDQHAIWSTCCHFACLKSELWSRVHRVPPLSHPTSL